MLYLSCVHAQTRPSLKMIVATAHETNDWEVMPHTRHVKNEEHATTRKKTKIVDKRKNEITCGLHRNKNQHDRKKLHSCADHLPLAYISMASRIADLSMADFVQPICDGCY